MKRIILFCTMILLASCSVISTPVPTHIPTLPSTETPVPTSTVLPTVVPATPEIAFGDISSLVALDGFSISVPFPYVHQVENNIILIANEKRSLNISFVGDAYDGSTALTYVINGYLGGLEKRGGSFETLPPEKVVIDGVEGVSVELNGKMGDMPIKGIAVAVSPRSDFVLFGLAMSNLDGGEEIWVEHRAVFEKFLQTIQFVDNSALCPVATDDTYGYSETNPIKVGGGDFNGPSREEAYLDHLRGPNGEVLSYKREGSLPSGDVILDAYAVTGPGVKAMLYIDEYNYSSPIAPVGFTCNGAFPLSQP